MSDLKKQNPSLESSLEDHLIPPEIVTDPAWNGKFRQFLDARASAILGHIERYVIEPAKEMEARYAASHESTERPESGPLARGLRTPESAFIQPILQTLASLHGRAPMSQVLETVGQVMKDRLQDVDYQPLMSEPGKPRWSNTAQWARNSMVSRGLLKKDSPRGVWEISEAGSEFLKKLSQRTA